MRRISLILAVLFIMVMSLSVFAAPPARPVRPSIVPSIPVVSPSLSPSPSPSPSPSIVPVIPVVKTLKFNAAEEPKTHKVGNEWSWEVRLNNSKGEKLKQGFTKRTTTDTVWIKVVEDDLKLDDIGIRTEELDMGNNTVKVIVTENEGKWKGYKCTWQFKLNRSRRGILLQEVIKPPYHSLGEDWSYQVKTTTIRNNRHNPYGNNIWVGQSKKVTSPCGVYIKVTEDDPKIDDVAQGYFLLHDGKNEIKLRVTEDNKRGPSAPYAIWTFKFTVKNGVVIRH